MKEYIVTRGGVELTMMLSDEDAKAMDARPVKGSSPKRAGDAKAAAPANKARAPHNK